MHEHTYVAVADPEGREVALLPIALPSEVGRLRYTNVKVGIPLSELTYICEEASSVLLAEDTAESDCTLAELLRLVLVLGIAELDIRSCAALGGHVVDKFGLIKPSLKAYQQRSPHFKIMTHREIIHTCASGTVYAG
jgi:hypothetical protein